MKNVYVFNKLNPTGYIMGVYPATKNVSEYLKDTDYTVCFTTDGAMYFLDLWADRFDAQARVEYRAFLEEDKEAEEREKAKDAAYAAWKAEQTTRGGNTGANAGALETLEGALCLAAQSIARSLSNELSEAIETREDIDRVCERIESYRLAMSALARALDKAELGKEEE